MYAAFLFLAYDPQKNMEENKMKKNYFDDPVLRLKKEEQKSNVKEFAEKIADEVINIKAGGHFNADSGYGKKFDKLLTI